MRCEVDVYSAPCLVLRLEKPSRPRQVAPQMGRVNGAFLVFQGPTALGAISVPFRRSLGKGGTQQPGPPPPCPLGRGQWTGLQGLSFLLRSEGGRCGINNPYAKASASLIKPQRGLASVWSGCCLSAYLLLSRCPMSLPSTSTPPTLSAQVSVDLPTEEAGRGRGQDSSFHPSLLIPVILTQRER